LPVLLSSGGGLARRLFESDAAQRVLPGLALHADVGPSDRFGAALGYVLGLGAATVGFPVPEGGAQRITNCLVGLLESRGGAVQLGARVSRIEVRGGRAVAVRLESGEEIGAREAIIADTSAPGLLLDLLEQEHVPSRLRRQMQHFEQGWGTFKVDWALSAPVPWNVPEAHQAAVVHTGESLGDLDRFTLEARGHDLPRDPYLVIGQASRFDPSRAPTGQHTLWAYSRVPYAVEGGWESRADAFADAIDERIEQLASGFRQTVLERHVTTPVGLERQNENLRKGDLGGGSNAFNHQLIWRPAFPHFRYRMPPKRLYLCSSYAHPGAGVHGMGGRNAALTAFHDIDKGR
jgi:phytoene dehydrogenase-like protein